MGGFHSLILKSKKSCKGSKNNSYLNDGDFTTLHSNPAFNATN